MAEEVIVRRCRAEEWQALRDLRLLALMTDRMAFGSTFEGESTGPSEMWQERARKGATGLRHATFVAEERPSGRLIGVGAIIPSLSPEDPSGFHVVGLWVRPERRRQGWGRRILEALVAFADSADPGAPLRLDVNPEQRSAVHLYEQQGFVATGRTEPLEHTPTVRLHEMVLRRDPKAGTHPM